VAELASAAELVPVLSLFFPVKGESAGRRRMCMSRPIETQIGEIRQYLEWEFPGQVRDTWWDEDAGAPVFEVVHETRCHHVIVGMGFIQACQDAVAFLRTSELADYMREARAQERRFLILEERGEVHIRSTPL